MSFNERAYHAGFMRGYLGMEPRGRWSNSIAFYDGFCDGRKERAKLAESGWHVPAARGA